MILILSEPTEKDIELVKQILGDKSVSVFEISSETKTKESLGEWLSPEQFEKEMKKKGYRCKQSQTRKELCNQHGIAYEKRGKTLWFKNELHKIPSKV